MYPNSPRDLTPSLATMFDLSKYLEVSWHMSENISFTFGNPLYCTMPHVFSILSLIGRFQLYAQTTCLAHNFVDLLLLVDVNVITELGEHHLYKHV